MDDLGSALEKLDGLLEKKGSLATAAAGVAAVALCWLLHPLVPRPGEPGFEDGVELLAVLAAVALAGPMLLLEGLTALVSPPPAPPVPRAPARFASFDEDLQRSRVWRRRIAFALVASAHAAVYFATI
ncbi:hypothetical protein [Nannocystis punicea]|uniref:Uncharacterized protein n=1 Tax=Nannocystis punicea TaxID=2995304 RepID=A0ABY7H4D4_9BACT|nr:hypothetical protein [Nannocystis poenicansa]WAS94146.1 hypothetical protein O0S08_49115 [Nannocystis poenicansa]